MSYPRKSPDTNTLLFETVLKFWSINTMWFQEQLELVLSKVLSRKLPRIVKHTFMALTIKKSNFASSHMSHILPDLEPFHKRRKECICDVIANFSFHHEITIDTTEIASTRIFFNTIRFDEFISQDQVTHRHWILWIVMNRRITKPFENNIFIGLHHYIWVIWPIWYGLLYVTGHCVRRTVGWNMVNQGV